MRKDILGKVPDFVAKRSLCVSLATKSGVVILGSLIGIWLMPSNTPPKLRFVSPPVQALRGLRGGVQ
ncbi:hypothetical protein [Nodularia sp. UHCC 0506]|uniref:hypothetical protein n=1 Tax=Nodularia sp. UHCC 0506 TaxID=3110243 RepID=UPI002B2206BF|nr:hypothetical protein [Nodularia sp. UHCC 0506]MEA5514028.1 hypothetical protein [Nodularia sp. UHCC 0506]